MRPLSLTIFTSFAARSTEPSLVAAQIARLNVKFDTPIEPRECYMRKATFEDDLTRLGLSRRWFMALECESNE